MLLFLVISLKSLYEFSCLFYVTACIFEKLTPFISVKPSNNSKNSDRKSKPPKQFQINLIFFQIIKFS